MSLDSKSLDRTSIGINPNKPRSNDDAASLERKRAAFDSDASDSTAPDTPAAGPRGGLTHAAGQDLLTSLCAALPAAGSAWSPAMRRAWLDSAEDIFAMVYPAR